jgi:AraC-like DNA-binding protein
VILVGIAGVGEQSTGSVRSAVSRTHSAVHSAGHAVDLTTAGFFEALSVSLKRPALVSELEKQLARPIGAPLEFGPSLSVASAGGAALWKTAMRLCTVLDEAPGNPRDSLAVRQMERSLMTYLIDGHRHNYTRLMHRALRAGPWQVRAAEEFIRANADRPLSLGDLASIAGVSARTLQYSFRQHRGMSPMDFLRKVRLERAREDLRSADSATTVTLVAARWGFFHFGRFAAQYQKLTGETPSATLRRGSSVRRAI